VVNVVRNDVLGDLIHVYHPVAAWPQGVMGATGVILEFGVLEVEERDHFNPSLPVTPNGTDL
jgi:hypothetical protein